MAKNTLTLYYKNGTVTADLFEDNAFVKNVAAVSLDEFAVSDVADETFDCIIVPGGVLKPLKKGLYAINEAAAADARDSVYGCHEYNRLTEVARGIAADRGVPAYMAFPMSSDELFQRNRISSNSAVRKYSRYYALEHAAAIETVARTTGDVAEDRNYIVAYIDDLVSVGAHMRGFCVDVNDMIGQEGPMGFTSSGDVPVRDIVAYAGRSDDSIDDICRALTKESGLLGYTGISEPEDADSAESDEAKLAIDTMIYQIAKWIGSGAMALQGNVDGIIVAGKGARSKTIVDGLRKRTGGIAPLTALEELDVSAYMAKLASVAGTFAAPVFEY